MYKKLGPSAKWEDDVTQHFEFDDAEKSELYSDLKDWSNSFNQYDNWVNLNSILVFSSNLETYMASAITLALESDPGTLFGASK